MALTKTAPVFENPDVEVEGESAADARVRAQLGAKVNAAPAEDPAPAAAEAKPSASREVAAAPTHAVATSIMKANPFDAIKNQLHVNFDELVQIKVTNGNVVNRKTGKLLGVTCVLELISFQDQWVMSPAAKKEDKEAQNYLKFSDDGVHVKGTGDLMTDVLNLAIEAGYKDSKIVKRVILVGAVTDGGKCPDMVGDLVQIDLAPRSMANWNTYQINTAFKVGKGLFPADQNPLSVRIIAVPQAKNGNDWTDAEFKAGYLPYTE
jgi:hypothetical protein